MKGGRNMPKIALLNVKGEKIKDIKLSDEVFGIEPNNQTIYDAVVLKQASMRQGTHKVKTRSEVSGGGRKPWRQKGTGNARQGSIRAPHFVGGGVVFGPTTERNYTKKQNYKENLENKKKEEIKKEKKQVANIEEHWGEIASSRECQLTDEDLQILKDFIKDL